MRPIKFKGKATMTIEELDDMHFEHDNGWFVGNLVMFGDVPYIVGDFIEVDEEYTINEFWVKVHPESVSQYTGKISNTQEEIFEGDILNVIAENIEYKDDYLGVVKMIDGSWMVDKNGNSEKYEMDHLFDPTLEIHVEGTVYEDKRLLEVQT